VIGDAAKHLVATKARGLDVAVLRATLERRPAARRKRVEEMARFLTIHVLGERTEDRGERALRRHVEGQADAPWDVTEQLVGLAFASRHRRSFDRRSHSWEVALITPRAIELPLQEPSEPPFLRTMPNARSAGCRVLTRALGVLTSATLASSTASADPKPNVDAPAQTSLYREDGLLGSVRTGPTVGFGAPDGARVGAFAKWRGVLAGGAALSYLPSLDVPGTNATVVRVSGEAFARVHPFRGAFFLGVAGGYAQTKGTLSDTQVASGQSQRVEMHAYARTFYVAPHLGFQWMLPLHLTVGFDLGVEIPVATTGPDFDASTHGVGLPVEARGAVVDTTRRLSAMPVPVIHLLEIGYAL
jgi:hypothetical protein